MGHNALSFIPNIFLSDPFFAASQALGSRWGSWGNYYRRYKWAKVYSNYKGKGAFDDSANYELTWAK